MDDYSTKKCESKFQKKIHKMIKDAKVFNQKIDYFIQKTEYERMLPPIRVNKEMIYRMKERERIIKNNRIAAEKQKKYEMAKRQYEMDLHNIMEKIFTMKRLYNT
jgi:hypothetical protein